MLREVSQPNGLSRLLRWTARRIDGHAVLVSLTGEPLHADPDVPHEILARAAADIQKVAEGQLRSAAVDVGGCTVCIVTVGDEVPQAVLVAATTEPLSIENRTVLAEAARLLWLRWLADDAERRGRHLDVADAHNREAVLHLLMVGHVSGARRSAAVLGPSLADIIRVYIVECANGAREQAARRCEEASGGRAWIVRCPVYSRHLIVLAPAGPAPPAGQRDDDLAAADPIDHALRTLARNTPDLYVGAGHTVALRDTATGYHQAFHALAVAKSAAGHYAGFTPQRELPQLLGVPGCVWARRELNPLLSYHSRRRQDPDASELLITLMAWLTFYGGAAAQLKIHRNTLSARLRRIERLIGYPLDDLPAQATVHLALQLLDEPVHEAPGTDDGAQLDTLLESPQVRRWATARLEPLLVPDQAAALETLRVWLDNNARLEPTAAALGLSVPAVRKRLLRIEETVKRSLLDGPSARYDMWYELRVYDRQHVPG